MNWLSMVDAVSKAPGTLKVLSRREMLDAPRFVLEESFSYISPEDRDFINSNGFSIPFETFAIEVARSYAKIYIWFTHDPATSGAIIVGCISSGDWYGVSVLKYFGGEYDLSSVTYRLDLKGRNLGPLPCDKATEGMASLCWNAFWRVIFDSSYPGNHVIRVREKNPHPAKMKWGISKEHYLIIDRKTEGRDVLDVSRSWPEEIRRAAHRRRAHMRLLSSPKWRNKMGTRVPVRAAWVGPKEWEGSDRKVYKVIT